MRQYCVIMDPVVGADGKPQLGQKRVVKGKCSFFLQPREHLEQGIQDVLSEEGGLVLGAAEAITDTEQVLQVHSSVFRRSHTPRTIKCTSCCEKFHCFICTKIFNTKEGMSHHLKVHKKNALKVNDLYVNCCHLDCDLDLMAKGPHFHCPFCGVKYRRKDTMRKHLPTCRSEMGECSFFLQPGEHLEQGIQDVLSEEGGLVLRAVEAFTDTEQVERWRARPTALVLECIWLQ